MALYVSRAKRLRRTIAIAVGVGAIALVLGWAIGRQQVPSVEDRVAKVQTSAGEIATGIERLDIEYEQVLAGDDSVDAGVIAPLDELRVSLVATLDDAPWVPQSTRDALLDQLAGIESSARATAPLEQFQAQLTEAGTSIRTAFGIS